MFTKILIANRGEIACRIIKTAKKLGIKTVAVYSEADAGARHVMLADEAIGIGSAPPEDSYLLTEKIIAAAKTTRAEAIHPGYGFLSENPGFANACNDADIIFIGPPGPVIAAMGSKSTAKNIMEQAGVPILPGYHGENQSPELLKDEAYKIGYPVMIKAAAGGGGKGIRIIDSEDKFEAGLESAKREARSSFGDDTVLVEKYLANPRHIEIQIFSDTKGNTVHLFERDCSLQRRHQKIIEEAPALGISKSLREVMGSSAIQAAKAINYVGAGTVEFICNEDNSYYFMEMNTRLQVEHPVTELITGQDMVEWQIRIAAGEELPCLQSELSVNGHAMEARIYAEEPGRGFLPATGHLVHLRFPINSKHIRIDTGVRQGDAITIHYDPMIAKLIVWDKDRKSCLKRMQAALGDTQIVGLATNIDFLSSVVSHPSFKKGQVNTGFIDRYRDELLLGGNPASESIIALATLYILVEHQKLMQEVAAQSNDPYSPWHLVNGWQMNLNSFKKVFFCDNNREYEAIIHYTTKAITIRVGDKSFSVSGLIDEQGDLAATLNDTHVHVTVVRQGSLLTLLHGGSSYQMTFIDKTVPDTQKESSPGGLMSPMPGRVLAILVNEQAKVKKGTPLMVIEAMKMEHTISAPVGGVVSAIYYPVGALIGEGVELLRLDGEDLPEDTFREL